MTPIELMRAQREFRLTCEELAETIDVSWSTLRRWRRGIDPVSAAASERIKALLSMPPDSREPHLFRSRMKYQR